jgi:Cdc6-like AAA superfamily ATPase
MAAGLQANLGEGAADTNVPRKGIAASDYRDITWELLDDHGIGGFVVILDEIDKLDDEDILRSLSRARESGKSDALIGVICISNKIAYRERLNERVDSSLQDNELVFDPYDADQLREILKHRRSRASGRTRRWSPPGTRSGRRTGRSTSAISRRVANSPNASRPACHSIRSRSRR